MRTWPLLLAVLASGCSVPFDEPPTEVAGFPPPRMTVFTDRGVEVPINEPARAIARGGLLHAIDRSGPRGPELWEVDLVRGESRLLGSLTGGVADDWQMAWLGDDLYIRASGVRQEWYAIAASNGMHGDAVRTIVTHTYHRYSPPSGLLTTLAAASGADAVAHSAFAVAGGRLLAIGGTAQAGGGSGPGGIGPVATVRAVDASGLEHPVGDLPLAAMQGVAVTAGDEAWALMGHQVHRLTANGTVASYGPLPCGMTHHDRAVPWQGGALVVAASGEPCQARTRLLAVTADSVLPVHGAAPVDLACSAAAADESLWLLVHPCAHTEGVTTSRLWHVVPGDVAANRPPAVATTQRTEGPWLVLESQSVDPDGDAVSLHWSGGGLDLPEELEWRTHDGEAFGGLGLDRAAGRIRVPYDPHGNYLLTVTDDWGAVANMTVATHAQLAPGVATFACPRLCTWEPFLEPLQPATGTPAWHSMGYSPRETELVLFWWTDEPLPAASTVRFARASPSDPSQVAWQPVAVVASASTDGFGGDGTHMSDRHVALPYTPPPVGECVVYRLQVRSGDVTAENAEVQACVMQRDAGDGLEPIIDVHVNVVEEFPAHAGS